MTLIPALFGLFGVALSVGSVQARRYWAPAPGILVGSIVSAAVAARQLWQVARNATAAIACAGVCGFGALYATPSLFPLVNASSEPPSFLLLHGFSIALFTAAALTAAGTWLTYRALRRAA